MIGGIIYTDIQTAGATSLLLNQNVIYLEEATSLFGKSIILLQLKNKYHQAYEKK